MLLIVCLLSRWGFHYKSLYWNSRICDLAGPCRAIEVLSGGDSGLWIECVRHPTQLLGRSSEGVHLLRQAWQPGIIILCTASPSGLVSWYCLFSWWELHSSNCLVRQWRGNLHFTIILKIKKKIGYYCVSDYLCLSFFSSCSFISHFLASGFISFIVDLCTGWVGFSSRGGITCDVSSYESHHKVAHEAHSFWGYWRAYNP